MRKTLTVAVPLAFLTSTKIHAVAMPSVLDGIVSAGDIASTCAGIGVLALLFILARKFAKALMSDE